MRTFNELHEKTLNMLFVLEDYFEYNETLEGQQVGELINTLQNLEVDLVGYPLLTPNPNYVDEFRDD